MTCRTARAPDLRDQFLADKFMDLESVVATAWSAAIAMETMFEDAGNPNTRSSEMLRKAVPFFKDYQILVLSEDQYLALDYLIRKTRDEAQAAYNAWSDALKDMPDRVVPVRP